MAYHVLKNAHVLPPEAELMKDIRILEDLLKHVEDEGERNVAGQKPSVENDPPRHAQAALDESHQSCAIIAAN